MLSMSACSASSRCWPSMARRMPSRSGHLQPADRGARLDRLERQLLVARDDDGAGNRRQVAGLTALLVVLHEFVDLSPDDLALVGLLARRDAPLEQVPVHLRRRLLLAAPNGLPGLAVVQHLEANQLVDVSGSQRGLIELHPKLLHPDGSHVNHSVLVPAEIAPRTEEANCSGLPPRISTRFSLILERVRGNIFPYHSCS